MQKSPLNLKNTSLAITERCTLKCKLCFAYIPYHENPQDMSLDEIHIVLERYFSIISSVDHFTITGGEPLLHPDLPTIIEMVKHYSGQINKAIDIITNGTLDMTDKAIECLKTISEKSRVIISDYGQYSPKTEYLANKLRKSGIYTRIEKYNGNTPLYGGWVDCQDHTLKHVTQEEVDKQGKSCYFKNKRGYSIRKGELHNCPRSYWRMIQTIIPHNPKEYIDLLDSNASIEQQRNVLKKLHKRISVTSCGYCWGANDCSRRYPPAEQL